MIDGDKVQGVAGAANAGDLNEDFVVDVDD